MFGRKKREQNPEIDLEAGREQSATATSPIDADDTVIAKEELADRGLRGPFDFAEAVDLKPYVDLGSILVPPQEGLVMRVEVEEATKRPIAVTLEHDGTLLQLQAFAAPKREGLWATIRAQLVSQVETQHGKATEFDGELGKEVHANLPRPNGGYQPVRFLGIDGPRWFLRGVVSGAALDSEERAVIVNGLFRRVVVRRGTQPMAPRELLPLHLPPQPEEQHDDASGTAENE